MEVRRGWLVPLAAVLVASSFLCRAEAAVMRDDDLKVGCYADTCPEAEDVVVPETMARPRASEAGSVASVMHLQFHGSSSDGCESCDGSVLTDAAPIATVLGRKDALSNSNIDSPRSLEVVDEIKEALRCPGVVPFADIVAMAARDPVVLVKDMMLNLEKGVKEGMDAPAHQAQAMAEDEEEDHLTLELLRAHQVEVGASLAGEMNHVQKKWLPYWFLAVASVIILTNHIRAAPVLDQLFPPELAVFAVLLCAISLIIRAMKQMTT